METLTIRLTNKSTEDFDNNVIYCSPEIDQLGTFWNYTRSGSIALSNCPNIEGFNINAYAERQCTLNGSWFYDNETGRYWSNYQPCLMQPTKIYTIYIFFIGHSISIVFLIFSLWIFQYFKELKCNRITLHKNLFSCYLINAISWLILHSLITNLMMNQTFCLFIFILASYFNAATYFWMLSEGIYLAIVLLQSMRVNLKYLMCYCYIIGWGFPFILCIICFLLRGSYEGMLGCWLKKTRLTYIIQVPCIITLAINLGIILVILKVLIRKMQYPPSTIEDRQWGRTGKSVFVLVLLLGIQNVFFLYIPKNKMSATILDYISALLSSLQGVYVSYLLCFTNKEIRISFKRRWTNQKTIKMSASIYNNRRSTITTINNQNIHLQLVNRACECNIDNNNNVSGLLVSNQYRRRLTQTSNEMKLQHTKLSNNCLRIHQCNHHYNNNHYIANSVNNSNNKNSINIRTKCTKDNQFASMEPRKRLSSI